MNSNDLDNSLIKNQKEKDNKNTNLIDENSWIKQVKIKKSTQFKEQDLSHIIRKHSVKKNSELKNEKKNRNSLIVDRGNLKNLLIPENSTESIKSINSDYVKNKKEENSDNSSNIISESNNESESQNENINEYINKNNKEYIKKNKDKKNKNNEINSEIKEEITEESKDDFNSKKNKILNNKKKNPKYIINKILSTEDKFQMLRQSYLKIPNFIMSKQNQKKKNNNNINNENIEKEKEILITPMSNSDNPELELLTHNPENRPINPFSIKCALLSDKGPLSARYNIDNNINEDNITEKKICKTFRKSTFGYLNEMSKSSSENNIFKKHYGNSAFNIIAPYTYRMDNINNEFYNVDNNQKKIFKHKKSKSSYNVIMPVNSEYKNSNFNNFIRNSDNTTNKINNDYSSNNSNLLKSSEEYNSLPFNRNLYRYPKKNFFKKIINNKNINKEYLISNLLNVMNINIKDKGKINNKHKKSNSISLSSYNCFSPSTNISQEIFNMKVNKIKNFLKLGKFNGQRNNYNTINNKELFYKYSDSKFKKQIFPPNAFDSKYLMYFK